MSYYLQIFSMVLLCGVAASARYASHGVSVFFAAAQCWLRMTWTCGGTSIRAVSLCKVHARVHTSSGRCNPNGIMVKALMALIVGCQGRRSCAQVFASICLRQSLSECKVADSVHMLCWYQESCILLCVGKVQGCSSTSTCFVDVT